MENFIKWTAWEMQTPQAYGTFHLLFTFIGLAVVILLAFLLRKLNDKQNRIFLLFIGLFLILTEIYKQLFYYYVIGNGNYVWWIFPFQLCSVPMYLCIVCGLCKNEKFNKYLYDFMFAFNFFGGIITFIEPSGINHPYLMLTLHAYVWHMLLIFLGFYLYFSKRACVSWKGYLKGLSVLGVSVVVAQIINACLKGIDGANMFYISPYVGNQLVFFKDFYSHNGWLANMCLYLFGLVLAGAIIFYIGYLIRYLTLRKNPKEKVNKKDG
ncbi:MAG: hypothetical protein E7375_00450 [Clostridiales bacterium]|nr:hypothetical protein [Clostridiales bacterium]